MIAGFYSLWVCDPAGQVADRIGQCARGNRVAGHQMGEIGSDGASSRCAPHGMTCSAFIHEELFAAFHLSGSRRWRRLKLMIEPRFEAGRQFRYHKNRHVGVLSSAKLGTLAAIPPRLVGLEPGYVGLTRDNIRLSA